MLIYAPRVMQAMLSAYADYRFYIWSGKKKWAMFTITVSWFWVYICTRTLTNTIEANLTTIALSYYPWYFNSYYYLRYAFLCCYIRPTSALVWIPLIAYHFYKYSFLGYKKMVKQILKTGYIYLYLLTYSSYFQKFHYFCTLFIFSILVGIVCLWIDFYFYDKFVITPLQFAIFNIYNDVSPFYGVHSW